MGELGPSSTLVSRATSAATSLMRSRITAFSMRSAAQVASASRLLVSISRCSLARSSCDCRNCLSSCAFSRAGFRLPARARARRPPVRRACRLRRVSTVRASLRKLSEAYSRSARKRPCSSRCADQFLHAAVEDFGFGGLRHQLTFELGEAVAEGFGLARALRRAGVWPARPRRCRVPRRSCRSLVSLLVAFDLALEHLDLGAQRDELDALAVGGQRSCRESYGVILASSA